MVVELKPYKRLLRNDSADSVNGKILIIIHDARC